MGPNNRKAMPMSTNTITRTPISQDEIELSLAALAECANENGLTPVRAKKGTHLTPQGILRAELGMSEKRSFSVIRRLKTLGLVLSTEHSTKVIIVSMMKDVAEGPAAPQPRVVTEARIIAALLKLRKENEQLRDENKRLTAEVDDLQKRVSTLELSSPALATLLSEVEAA